MNRKLRGLLFTVPGIAIGLISAQSCSNAANALPGLGDLPKQCGLVCPDNGVAEGNASISGIASIDGFFSTCVDFQTTASGIADGIQGELDAIAASVGATAGDSADLKAKLAAKIKANVDGSLTVKYQPPQCTVSAKATLEAQAKCDASVDPGSASVKCQGSCTAKAGVMVDCGASAKLSCTGTAPMLKCSGTCQGECQLDAAASCSGTCNGTCSGNCSVKDASGNCAGSCDGMCKGSCQLSAAATCGGSCKGSCTYQPAMAMCDASAQAHCDATGSAQVDCQGSCTGQVTPPMAKAECQASAKANASIKADCKPPSLDVQFKLLASVSGDAMGTATFQSWLEGFKGHVSAILAYKAKIDGLASVGGDLGSSGEAAIQGSIKAIGNLNVKTTVGVGCALTELPKAIKVVTDAAATLTDKGKTTIDVLGSVGVS